MLKRLQVPPQQKNKENSHPVDERELKRLRTMAIYEEKARQQGYKLVAGIDEAGRGPLAGPVVAAACILPLRFHIPGVNDSKKLTAQKRAQLFQEITQHPEVTYGIGVVATEIIDRINILQATIQAMLEAVTQLSSQPHALLVDGLQLPHPTIPCQKIIKGDSLSLCIAAASILAKETRDRLMLEYDQQWPEYGFAQHKGYGTQQHLEALKKHGPCAIHRKTFEPIKSLFVEALNGPMC
ncbi:ribonuclease HII [Parachlamydia sp. AcF125]|uniref:ribonuclease HII n=1 Tax=Parachlamydia sp. AcF125 TaxID=2795736 RepID=UPI001BC90140|nr:ribonuclease HII [Parachlamydia sp. AcF125]MBS4168775.1 Ribonuclease HII [Parachlamydia sp. AcF125]